jgi:hypothetical protein
VLSGAAEGEQDEALPPGVHELTARGRPDAHEAVRVEHMLDALNEQGERALEDEIHLLLTLVCVDAAALAGLQHDEVDAEALNAQLASQRLKAFAAFAVERGERDVG